MKRGKLLLVCLYVCMCVRCSFLMSLRLPAVAEDKKSMGLVCLYIDMLESRFYRR